MTHNGKLVNANGIQDALNGLLPKYSFTWDYVTLCVQYSTMKNANLETLQPLLQNKIITNYMAGKIAGSGLSLDHLKLSFERDNDNGLYHLFAEKVFGTVRVTSNKAIIQAIQNYLSQA